MSQPPTICKPSPIFSLLISIVDSTPGIIGAVAAKLSSSNFNFPEGDGDNEPGGGASSVHYKDMLKQSITK